MSNDKSKTLDKARQIIKRVDAEKKDSENLERSLDDFDELMKQQEKYQKPTRPYPPAVPWAPPWTPGPTPWQPKTVDKYIITTSDSTQITTNQPLTATSGTANEFKLSFS